MGTAEKLKDATNQLLASKLLASVFAVGRAGEVRGAERFESGLRIGGFDFAPVAQETQNVD
jgi:hypothetical protein